MPDKTMVARLLLHLAGGGHEPVYHLTSEEEADRLASDTEVARGEFATGEQVLAIWAKHDL